MRFLRREGKLDWHVRQQPAAKDERKIDATHLGSAGANDALDQRRFRASGCLPDHFGQAVSEVPRTDVLNSRFMGKRKAWLLRVRRSLARLLHSVHRELLRNKPGLARMGWYACWGLLPSLAAPVLT
jgi:hypothetical protein